MIMCHGVRSWYTSTPTRQLFPVLIDHPEIMGKCAIYIISGPSVQGYPDFVRPSSAILTYPNVFKLVVRLFIHSIYYLTYDILTGKSFLSAQIFCGKFNAGYLLWWLLLIYRLRAVLMTRTPLSNFRRVSAPPKLKMGIGFSCWLSAMSVSSKYNGKGHLRICFN